MGVIQYNKTLFEVKYHAENIMKNNNDFNLNIIIPAGKPRMNGEVLGCTSQELPENIKVVFISDGRFHIESTMVQNPTCEF